MAIARDEIIVTTNIDGNEKPNIVKNISGYYTRKGGRRRISSKGEYVVFVCIESKCYERKFLLNFDNRICILTDFIR